MNFNLNVILVLTLVICCSVQQISNLRTRMTFKFKLMCNFQAGGQLCQVRKSIRVSQFFLQFSQYLLCNLIFAMQMYLPPDYEELRLTFWVKVSSKHYDIFHICDSPGPTCHLAELQLAYFVVYFVSDCVCLRI